MSLLKSRPCRFPGFATLVDEVLSTGCRAEAEAEFGRGEIEGYYLFPRDFLQNVILRPGHAWRSAGETPGRPKDLSVVGARDRLPKRSVSGFGTG